MIVKQQIDVPLFLISETLINQWFQRSKINVSLILRSLNSKSNKILIIEKNATIAGGTSSNPVSTSVDVSDIVPDGYFLISCAINRYPLPYYNSTGELMTWADMFTSDRKINVKNKTTAWSGYTIRAIFVKP